MSARTTSIQFNGLPALRLETVDGATAVIALHGAQVLSWVPAGGEERLYLSERAHFADGVAIRGGIPVCFPQFSGLGELPRHGFARTRAWTLLSQQTGAGHAMVTLESCDDAHTRALWPHHFRAELTVLIEADRLDVEFSAENSGDAPFAFTAALHSYLRVQEVEAAVLEGLHGHRYRDAAHDDAIVEDTASALRVDAPVDRVYHDVRRPLTLRDGKRALNIHTEGFPDAVVWNPWEQGAAALNDMLPQDFRHMLCVEAAAAHAPVTVGAGEEWWGRQSLIAL